jgi:hypothetical protein
MYVSSVRNEAEYLVQSGSLLACFEAKQRKFERDLKEYGAFGWSAFAPNGITSTASATINR